jgi:large subunit ribosomal protein L10
MVSTYKIKIVEQLKKELEQCQEVIVVGYKGLAVETFNELRAKLVKAGARCRVVKNTLVDKALVELKLKGLAGLVEGETAVIMGREGNAMAKIAADFSKENEVFVIRGGLIEKSIFNKDRVLKYAYLPSREELLSQLAVSVKAPLYMLVNSLSGCITNLVRVLDSVKSKKSEN